MAITVSWDAGAASPPGRRSIAHSLSLFFVWLAVASGAIVTTEPAPFDALVFGLAILLPAVGLTLYNTTLIGLFAAMLVMGVAALIGVALAQEPSSALIHTSVSIYLYLATFTLATFVACKPVEHGRLMLRASLAGALFAALCGIVGYFDLFPGAADLMTRYSRASGLFKDPNVFGPFLVIGFVYAFSLIVTRPLHRTLLPAIAFALLSFGLLLSFSRGAWTNAGIALALYALFYVLTAPTHVARLKFMGTLLFGAVALGGVFLVALQFDAVANLLSERAALTQGYDEGPEGRFGGQQKAIKLAIENPLGIGAQQFPTFHHHEEAHNVYISMFLNAGWLGGVLFIALMVMTSVAGFRHALLKVPSQPLFIVAYGTLVGHVAEGVLIDLDHWRHVYVVLAIVWGMMAGDRLQRANTPSAIS